MSQSFPNFVDGSYKFTFTASQRHIPGKDNTQNQTVHVRFDRFEIGPFAPADTNWYTAKTAAIFVAAGMHTVTLICDTLPGDSTVLIDQINVASVTASPGRADPKSTMP